MKKEIVLGTLLLMGLLSACSKEEPSTPLAKLDTTIVTDHSFESLSSEEQLEIYKNQGFLIEEDESGDYILQSYDGSEAEVKIPLIVKTIGSEAFLGNKDLVTITIKDNVKQIMFGAFNECSNLQRIYISDSVESIVNPFMFCDQLTVFVKEESFADQWISEYNKSLESQNLSINVLVKEYF